jgi:6-phosphogluconolactonase
MHEWIVRDDFEQASQAAADFIADKINETLQKKGICHLALPGGNTPAYCLELLSKKDLPWHKLHLYLGDERCLPEDDPERNDVMLETNLLSKIPCAYFYRIPAELGPEHAAMAYAKKIDAIERLDIVFLGMGEDGHTASLFPGNRALLDKHSVVAVYNSPKAPDERVSLGMKTLQGATYRIVLTTGQPKAEIISQIKAGKKLPVNSIGDIHWFVDSAACEPDL